jgi:hypothetical protein
MIVQSISFRLSLLTFIRFSKISSVQFDIFFHEVVRVRFGSVRIHFSKISLGSVRFGSNSFPKSRFEFGSDRLVFGL